MHLSEQLCYLSTKQYSISIAEDSNLVNVVALSELYSVHCDWKFIVILVIKLQCYQFKQVYFIWTFTTRYFDHMYFCKLFTYQLFWDLFKVIILKFSTLINSIYICSGAWTTSEEKGFSRWCKSSSLNADLCVNDLFCKGLLEMCFYYFVISF
jgi:hypothetical protein